MDHKIVGRTEWLEARRALLAREKAFTAERDALSATRREMPWVQVDAPYEFDTSEGRKNLGDLFGSRSQLVVYHFMFGPEWQQGCKSCSFWADNFNGIDIHLAHRDVAFVAVSRAALETLDAFKTRMGWSFEWVSSAPSSFSKDFGVSFDAADFDNGTVEYNYQPMGFETDELPGVSVFAKRGDLVFHTYSTYSRGIDILNGAHNYLDLTPKGRDEDGLEFNMSWLRHKDRY